MIEDAPVFYPSTAEFNRGPISYIAKIRSQAEKYGICKIVPPKSFKPPFAVDINCFKFTPRLQRLNELEASVRAKLNFIDQLFKFWELQACTIRVPYIDGRLLDLHKLYDCVKAEGGFETCVCERKWAKVTQRMGYQTNSQNRGTIASLLRHHYEKILYPYDMFAEFSATIRDSHYSHFGFRASKNHYTLAEFEQMANQFKSNYFKRNCSEVPLAAVEQEYWRLVTSLEDNVCVEYGADLHCNDFGSGFPTKTNKDLLGLKSNEYVDHPWNLNNMPVADGSVFKYINTNISGMITPWMYVGMCFSTFCWHNEDHWTYSINYLHYGEAKTWYGVPGCEAEAFEKSMKRVAPELFESQPDLLHQLVTICNPSTLIEDKVPVYKVNQFAGEFVVTFPRAYHTGFNQGLNFAEAVNFAPADWLKLGRQCIDHYASLRRFPVFSQDELICKMASNPSTLDYTTSLATLQDFDLMLESETRLRSETLDSGVIKSERYMFENYPDDERQCRVCKTTCFLSALSCQCDDSSASAEASASTNSKADVGNKRLVCLIHKDRLCKCCEPINHTLKFRYTLNELPVLERRMRKHIMLIASGTLNDTTD